MTEEKNGAEDLTSKHDVFDRFAKTVPLVTTVSKDLLMDLTGLLPTSMSRACPQTREIEKNIGHEPSLYFFAGRYFELRNKRYRFVFAFSPEIEANHNGFANPFDTGMAWLEFYHSITKANAKSLVDCTKYDLKCWRSTFNEYLESFFTSPVRYLSDNGPDKKGKWGPPELPAKFCCHTIEYPYYSWTWEVRFHEGHRVDEGILLWACGIEDKDYLETHLSNSDHPLTDEAKWSTLISKSSKYMAFKAFEEEITKRYAY